MFCIEGTSLVHSLVTFNIGVYSGIDKSPPIPHDGWQLFISARVMKP